MSKCPECDAWTKNNRCKQCGWQLEPGSPHVVHKCMRCGSEDISASVINKRAGIVTGHLCQEHTPLIDKDWRDKIQEGLKRGLGPQQAIDWMIELESKRA